MASKNNNTKTNRVSYIGGTPQPRNTKNKKKRGTQTANQKTQTGLTNKKDFPPKPDRKKAQAEPKTAALLQIAERENKPTNLL